MARIFLLSRIAAGHVASYDFIPAALAPYTRGSRALPTGAAGLNDEQVAVLRQARRLATVLPAPWTDEPRPRTLGQLLSLDGQGRRVGDRPEDGVYDAAVVLIQWTPRPGDRQWRIATRAEYHGVAVVTISSDESTWHRHLHLTAADSATAIRERLADALDGIDDVELVCTVEAAECTEGTAAWRNGIPAGCSKIIGTKATRRVTTTTAVEAAAGSKLQT